MVDENGSKWNHTNNNIPKRTGKIPDIQRFDHTFFGITKRQAQSLHPQSRIALEVAYETILDAGINPQFLRGSRTGVYLGICFSDEEQERKSNAIFGSRSMAANLISYCFDLKGPSVCIDTACSSSGYALDQAFTAFRCGQIDFAIVGGCNLILNPETSENLSKLGALSKTGLSTPFDERACGYTRAEAISCIFLQRNKDVNRIYGYLIYSKTNTDGHKTMGVTFPSVDMQTELLSGFYEDLQNKVSVDDLGYFEAHGSGTKVGDPVEIEAIDRAITSKGKEPLLIGSVKSNMGHSEGSSAISGIIKVLLTFSRGKIPPNLNFVKANHKLKAIVEGRLRVVDKIEDLTKPYAAVSSFGIGGSNFHVLLKAYEKKKINESQPETTLIIWSGP